MPVDDFCLVTCHDGSVQLLMSSQCHMKALQLLNEYDDCECFITKKQKKFLSNSLARLRTCHKHTHTAHTDHNIHNDDSQSEPGTDPDKECYVYDLNTEIKCCHYAPNSGPRVKDPLSSALNRDWLKSIAWAGSLIHGSGARQGKGDECLVSHGSDGEQLQRQEEEVDLLEVFSPPRMVLSPQNAVWT